MDPFKYRQTDGIYHVFITPVEHAHPEVKAWHAHVVSDGDTPLLELIRLDEIYRYALGFMNDEDYAQFEFYMDYFEAREQIEKLVSFIKQYYHQVIPIEFQNKDCFSLLDITPINPGLHMYRFTCELPIEIAESKEHGIDFEYLRQYFAGPRTP